MASVQETASSTLQPQPAAYPARLQIDYPEKLDRLSTFFRMFAILPILAILALVAGTGQTITNNIYLDQAGQVINQTRETAGGLAFSIPAAVALMILFRQRYPRWWFDFLLQLNRFGTRVGAYAALLTDVYPSTVEEQCVHLELEYPDVEKDLKRWMPLVKMILAIPHYFLLGFLSLASFFVVVVAWFAILFTGYYPRGLFDFVVGVQRWWLRVNAYAVLMLTDQYPPFSLK